MHAIWISSALIAAAAAQPPAFTRLPDTGTVQAPAIKEASGLAASGVDPRFLWVVNDSGAGAEIHLISSDGEARGSLKLKGARNVDWEDIAGFTLDGKNYLLVADTGDNNSKRESCTLYVVREPTLPPTGKDLEVTTETAWRVDFQYEGGPRDCEAVAVDARGGEVILISKRTTPPEVYQLPLRPADGLQIARQIGTTSVKCPLETPLPFANQPTGLALARDGSMAAVVTYYGIFVFPHERDESWSQAFGREPLALPPHRLRQAESVTFSGDGQFLQALSEGLASPIARYQKVTPVTLRPAR